MARENELREKKAGNSHARHVTAYLTIPLNRKQMQPLFFPELMH